MEPTAEPIVTNGRAMPAWAISVVTHGAILFVFSLVVFLTRPADEEVPPVHIPYQAPLPERTIGCAETITNDPSDVVVEVAPTSVDVANPQTDLAVTDVMASTEADDPADTPHGDPNAVSDENLGSTGFTGSLGAGGGDKGFWGTPGAGGTTRNPGRNLTNRPNEDGVNHALRWFKRHQSVDGRWDVDGYAQNCTEAGAKCEPGRDNTGIGGDIACTGYALLCFLSHGYDHRMPSAFKSTVAKGVAFLIATQKADGSFGERNYEHAVATLALADCYGMTVDPALREPLQKAVAVIIARQAKDAAGGYALGWDYVAPNPSRIDASVSGWNVMALKSASAGGIDVGTSLRGADRWLQRAWESANPKHTGLDVYKDATSFPYTWNATNGAVDIAAPGADEHDMAAVGALCAVFLGHHAGDAMLETLCNHIERYQTPVTWPMNTYYLYYDAMALAQCDRARFRRWNEHTSALVVAAQRRDDGCFDGSWDFAGTKFPGHETGRLLSTAYCCLALEAGYHWQGAADAHERERQHMKRTW